MNLRSRRDALLRMLRLRIRSAAYLEAGDHLTVFTAPPAREALQSLLASRIATQSEAS